MTSARTLSSFVRTSLLSATLASISFAPGVAHADVHAAVEGIAAKGTIPPVVPVEAGLGFGLAAALVAFAIDRRSRR